MTVGPPVCADFDGDGGSLPMNWAPVTLMTIPPPHPTNQTFVSCPASMAVDVPSMTNGGAVSALVTLGPSATTVVLTFDVLLPALSGGGTPSNAFDFVYLHKGTDPSYEVRVERGGTGQYSLHIAQGMTPDAIADISNPLLGMWNHMVLTVVFSSSTPGNATLQYMDESSQQQTTGKLLGLDEPPGTAGNAPISVSIGVGTLMQTSQAFSVLFDNVTMTGT
jgi:hypothetical protein